MSASASAHCRHIITPLFIFLIISTHPLTIYTCPPHPHPHSPSMSKNKKQKREPTRRQVRAQDTLIQKSQVNNPKLDEDMEKILNSIVQGIRHCPPAQPRRKYQKASDIESNMSRNIRSVNQSKNDTTKHSENVSVASSRSNYSQNYKRQMAPLDRKTFLEEDKKSKNTGKEVLERNQETKSNHSTHSHQNTQKSQSEGTIIKQKSNNIKPTTQLAVSNETTSQSDRRDGQDTTATQNGQLRGKLQKEMTMPRPYNPMKRHIGEGMILRKFPANGGVIDLDSDGSPQKAKLESQTVERAE